MSYLVDDGLYRDTVQAFQYRIAILERENARMREALEKIADYGPAIGCNPAGLTEIARKALEQ